MNFLRPDPFGLIILFVFLKKFNSEVCFFTNRINFIPTIFDIK